MPRTFRGPDLTLWEAYLDPARGGSAHSARWCSFPGKPTGPQGWPGAWRCRGAAPRAEGMLEELGLSELRDLPARAVLLT